MIWVPGWLLSGFSKPEFILVLKKAAYLSKYFLSHFTKILFVWSRILYLNRQNIMTDNLHSVSLFTIICAIILQARDIETNPGPTIPENNFLLSILHCNIRSIRNKINYIKEEFLDFNILCFTETHLNDPITQDNLFLSQTFDQPYRRDRTNHGGGILVYVNNDLAHSRVADLEGYCNESIWVKIIVKSKIYI